MKTLRSLIARLNRPIELRPRSGGRVRRRALASGSRLRSGAGARSAHRRAARERPVVEPEPARPGDVRRRLPQSARGIVATARFPSRRRSGRGRRSRPARYQARRVVDQAPGLAGRSFRVARSSSNPGGPEHSSGSRLKARPRVKLSASRRSSGHRSGANVVGLDIQPGFIAAVEANVNGSIRAVARRNGGARRRRRVRGRGDG